MSAVQLWAGDEEPARHLVPRRAFRRPNAPGELPAAVEQAIWRGSDLGHQAGKAVSSGFAALDAELPGGGWPCQAVTEVLSAQPSVMEWRLVGPALRAIVAAGGQVAVVGAPKVPHLPDLRHVGVDAKHLIWVRADAPAERLWCTEQLVKSAACGALLAWLPQARPEHVRRLQVCAQACEGPFFIFRPAAAQHEASAAPLRVFMDLGLDWEIRLRILKRRGASHDGELALPSVPGGLEAILTPRLQRPSQLFAARGLARRGASASEVAGHALGSTPSSVRPRTHAAAR
ncbi:MAG: translesion DNA synthesis-associated protein ImuA [Rubrivivax sp.]